MKNLRKKIALLMFAFAISLTTSPSSANVGSCAPSSNSCNFYSCQEYKRPCGENGYWKNYAIPYCNDFLKTQKEYSQVAQKFLTKVRFCLQNSLNEKTHSISCRDIQREAFDSHVQCYVDSGFCNLGLKDRVKIAAEIPRAFFNKQTWKEGLAVDDICSQRRELERLWAR